jgi:Integrase core domain
LHFLIELGVYKKLQKKLFLVKPKLWIKNVGYPHDNFGFVNVPTTSPKKIMSLTLHSVGTFLDESHNSILPVLDLIKHSPWVPKKLLEILGKHYDDLAAVSTTADILKRNGLITFGERRLRRYHTGCPQTTTAAPNDIWTADYKGHFKTRNGLYCNPLTVCDMHSRYLLGCDAHEAISTHQTKSQFTKIFRESGLPQRVRTDKGVPVASSAIARSLYGGSNWEYTWNR